MVNDHIEQNKSKLWHFFNSQFLLLRLKALAQGHADSDHVSRYIFTILKGFSFFYQANYLHQKILEIVRVINKIHFHVKVWIL